MVDAASGRLVGIDQLVERDSAGFVDWLSGYVAELGVKAIVSDDLSAYKSVVEELGLEHQICLAHVRKNVSRRLKRDRWMGVAQGKDMVVAERVAGGRRRGVDQDGAQGEGECGAEAVSRGVKQQVEESD